MRRWPRELEEPASPGLACLGGEGQMPTSTLGPVPQPGSCPLPLRESRHLASSPVAFCLWPRVLTIPCPSSRRKSWTLGLTWDVGLGKPESGCPGCPAGPGFGGEERPLSHASRLPELPPSLRPDGVLSRAAARGVHLAPRRLRGKRGVRRPHREDGPGGLGP